MSRRGDGRCHVRLLTRSRDAFGRLHCPGQSSTAIAVAAPIADNTPAPTDSDRSLSRVGRFMSVLRRRHIPISHTANKT
jgi:hypothetical protein